jgi:molybdenum cofactor biosynthesis protein B
VSGSSRDHKSTAPTTLGFALITCSTSRFAASEAEGPTDDPSGDLVARTLNEAGHTLASRTLVPDNAQLIQTALAQALENRRVEAVIISGGTGITPRDLTIEAVTPMLEKQLPGFGEVFRALSYERIGSAAILSRAVAGAAHGKAVFCIPGSIDAVKLCLDKLILPEAGHVVKHAREKP